MSKRHLYFPGEFCTVSGQYDIVYANGRLTGVERGINAGDPFPPTEKKGQKYLLVDPTKTKMEEVEMKESQSTKSSAISSEKGGVEQSSFWKQDPEEGILRWTTAIAVIKSVLKIGLGVYFLYLGVTFLGSLIRVTLDMKLFAMVEPAMFIVREWIESSNTNLQVTMALISMISILAILILAISPGMLLFLGYKLLTEEVFEKELDKTGNLILRLRSGLGKVKPVEEMIHSIFGRSRSAWDLQLWASRITFFVGLIILFVAVVQLLVPDLFGSGVDKAIFFGAGAGASVLSMFISHLLNPAKELQAHIVQNADIELATINYVKQAELVDGWMTRALLSLKDDNDWSPENKVLSSLKINADALKKALEDSVKTIDATKATVPVSPTLPGK